MSEAKLKFSGREITLGNGVIVCGRSSENAVAFPQDSNVSRYHAEIENRGDEYWLIDLGSSNGTTLNGQKVTSEKLLKNGDVIVFGGSSELIYEVPGEAVEEEDSPETQSSGASPSLPSGGGMSFPSGGGGGMSFPAGGMGGSSSVGGAMPSVGSSAAAAPAASNTTLLVAGGVCGLALVCVVGAGVFYMTRGSGCDARALIVKPEPGDTIIAPTDIELETQNTECVSTAVFTIDGQEVAKATEPPFTAKLDPKEFPDLSDGVEHNLQIVLIDSDGQQIPQPESVLLAFETREIAKPSPTPEIAQANTDQTPTGKKGKAPTLIDIQEMSKRFVKQFSGNFQYNVSNKQFLSEIQKKTAEYAQEGYSQRALAFRDVINVAYVQEQNLDAPLGFALAMSRSKFNNAKQGTDEGLWKMSSEFVVTNGYNGLCGTESLSDPSQNCAAKASAIYLKAIIFGVFDGDMIYGAAVFGKSTQDAGAWKASLPANRSDIWNSIKTPQERDQIVRFFAAGIVAENPQKFGLNADKPLSELYRVTM